jgi:hypothetical protein
VFIGTLKISLFFSHRRNLDLKKDMEIEEALLKKRKETSWWSKRG